MAKYLQNSADIEISEIGDNLQFDIIKTDFDVYSTTEKVIGSWIDGRPIYRKVIHYTGTLTSGGNNINHGISNLDNVIRTSGFIPFGSGSGKTSYMVFGYADSTQFINVINIKQSVITMYIGSAWASSFTNGCYIILEYTKTTD